MRVKHFVTGMLVLFLGFVLAGCAGMSTKTTADITCTTKNIDAMLQSCEYQKKFDNFLIIMDASSSMGDKLGPLFSKEPSKLVLEKDIITCLNNSLPDNFDINAGLRVFGPTYSEKGLIYGMNKYSKAGMEDAVKSVNGTGGVTPLANAITWGNTDLHAMPGNAAVIIFSDGINTDLAHDPVAAAAAMKEMYGDNVCIFTVLLGNDPKGKITMEQIAEAGKCGFATDVNNLHSRVLSEGCEEINFVDGMGDFVSSVFVEKVPDSDGDGVTDKCDKCPNTPMGVKVDSVGCPPAAAPVAAAPVPIPAKVNITLLVEFDFDKDMVKPQFHNDLEKVANFLKEYPKTTAELEGHTDSVGTDEYNMNLSERRAASVKKYLVGEFNIDAARISTVGYGESKPVASNDTAAGRQMNRRVVANIVTIVVK